MTVNLSLYLLIIYTVAFTASGVLIGISYSWYRVNMKKLAGRHGGDHRPTYRNAYEKGWRAGYTKGTTTGWELHEASKIPEPPIPIKTETLPEYESRIAELRGSDYEDGLNELTAEQWALRTES